MHHSLPPPTLENVRRTLDAARVTLARQRGIEAKFRRSMALGAMRLGGYVPDDQRFEIAAQARADGMRIEDVRERIAALVDLVSGLEQLEKKSSLSARAAERVPSLVVTYAVPCLAAHGEKITKAFVADIHAAQPSPAAIAWRSMLSWRVD